MTELRIEKARRDVSHDGGAAGDVASDAQTAAAPSNSRFGVNVGGFSHSTQQFGRASNVCTHGGSSERHEVIHNDSNERQSYTRWINPHVNLSRSVDATPRRSSPENAQTLRLHSTDAQKAGIETASLCHDCTVLRSFGCYQRE